MIQVEAYIKFLVNVAKQCTLWERALKIRFRLDLWLSCLLTSDFYRWLWIRSYSFVKKGRENFLYKTETNSFHFFHFDKVESLYFVHSFRFWQFWSHDTSYLVWLRKIIDKCNYRSQFYKRHIFFVRRSCQVNSRELENYL